MRRFKRLLSFVTAVTFGLIFLCACSGHQSISSTPANDGYLPAAPATQSSSNHATAKAAAAKPATLRVTDLDGGAEASGSQSKALPIVNGSQLRISLTGNSVTSATVEAGDSSAVLEPTGEGQWTAVIRYVDTSNPPVENPVLEVKMQTSAGQRTFRIPVLELHQ